jgi:3-dehydroquinate synthetase
MCAPEVRGRLRAVLHALHLPTELEGDLDSMLDAAAHDKKREGDQISVVWVDRIGSCEIRRMPLSVWKNEIRNYYDQ